MTTELLDPINTTELAPSDGSDHQGSDPAVRCTGLEKRFGLTEVVRGVDLEAAQGQLLALLGPSGCGKTTTLRLIAGLETLDAGTVEIAGQVVARPGRHLPPERRRVGMVFQDYALFPHLSVARNVGFGLGRRDDPRRRVAETLALVGLNQFADRMPHELSGGQQQRVALARALAPRPAVVLLDEPFSNLDPELRTTVRAEVRQILADAGATAILVTHDQEEALSLADRIAVMWDGRIVQTANPEELYHRPVDSRVASFVGDAQFIHGDAQGRRVVTELGILPLAGQAEGSVDVLLRPETLRLAHVPEGEPTNALVTRREFFGHHQLLSVQLDTGTRLRARLGSYGGIRQGDRVQANVRGAVLAFPRTEPLGSG